MISFLVRDRDHPDYHSKRSNKEAGKFPTRVVARKGKLFQIGFETVELFTFNVLTEALDRSKLQVRQWEQEGFIPRPMFKVPNSNQRMYSGNQIINLHRLMWFKYQCRKNNTFNLQEFSRDVKKVFYERDIVVDEHGVIRIPPKNRAVGR